MRVKSVVVICPFAPTSRATLLVKDRGPNGLAMRRRASDPGQPPPDASAVGRGVLNCDGESFAMPSTWTPTCEMTPVDDLSNQTVGTMAQNATVPKMRFAPSAVTTVVYAPRIWLQTCTRTAT